MNSRAATIGIIGTSSAEPSMERNIEAGGTRGRLLKTRTIRALSFVVLREVISLPNYHLNFVTAPVVALAHFTFVLMADVRYVICYVTN